MQCPRQRQRNIRLLGDGGGPGDDLIDLFTIGRLGGGQIALPFAGREGRAGFAVAADRGMAGKRGAVAGKAERARR